MVVAGNVYRRPVLDGEGEHIVDVVERVGEDTCGMSIETAAASLRVGDLWGGRSL